VDRAAASQVTEVAPAWPSGASSLVIWVSASLATLTKLLLLKAVTDRQCRAFSASAAEPIKYLEVAAEKAAGQNSLKSVNLILSGNGRGGGCRERQCTRCRKLFSDESSALEAKTTARGVTITSRQWNIPMSCPFSLNPVVQRIEPTEFASVPPRYPSMPVFAYMRALPTRCFCCSATGLEQTFIRGRRSSDRMLLCPLD